MIGPDIVYQYSQPKDVMGGTLLILNQTVVKIDTAQNIVETLGKVPNDKVLILSAVQAYMKSQTAGSADALAVSILFEGSSTPLIFIEPHLGTQTNLAENWTGQVWIPPGSELEMAGTFSDAINTHVLRFSIHGILIPRGNVQQG